MEMHTWIWHRLKWIFEPQYLCMNTLKMPVSGMRVSFGSVPSGAPSHMLNTPHFVSAMQPLECKPKMLKFALQGKQTEKGNRWSLIL